jgi:hypothetical protein
MEEALERIRLSDPGEPHREPHAECDTTGEAPRLGAQSLDAEVVEYIACLAGDQRAQAQCASRWNQRSEQQ